MRGRFSYILIFFIFAGIAVACINEDVRVLEPDYDICFDVAIGSVTKADGKNDYPEDVPFRLWAVRDSDALTESEQYIDGQSVLYDRGLWKTERQYFWPDSSRLSFFAYSPADAAAAFSVDRGIVYQDFNALRDDSFLCTFSATEVEKPDTEDPISLVFISPLSRLEFSAFSSAAEDAEIVLTGLTLQGLKCKGDFSSVPEFSWTELTEDTDIKVFEGRITLSETTVEVVDAINVIPQDISVRVNYEYVFDSSAEVHYGEIIVSPVKSMKPECGKWRPYVLKISTEHVEIQKPKRYEE